MEIMWSENGPWTLKPKVHYAMSLVVEGKKEKNAHGAFHLRESAHSTNFGEYQINTWNGWKVCVIYKKRQIDGVKLWHFLSGVKFIKLDDFIQDFS